MYIHSIHICYMFMYMYVGLKGNWKERGNYIFWWFRVAQGGRFVCLFQRRRGCGSGFSHFSLLQTRYQRLTREKQEVSLATLEAMHLDVYQVYTLCSNMPTATARHTPLKCGGCSSSGNIFSEELAGKVHSFILKRIAFIDDLAGKP